MGPGVRRDDPLIVAPHTGSAAGLVLAAASNLSKQAEQLSGEVNTFLAGVRAA